MQERKQYGYKDWVHILDWYIEAVRIDCDSQSAIFLVKNLTYHSKTNHTDFQYHFVRGMVE
jgi:hypothetical protein